MDNNKEKLFPDFDGMDKPAIIRRESSNDGTCPFCGSAVEQKVNAKQCVSNPAHVAVMTVPGDRILADRELSSPLFIEPMLHYKIGD